MAISVSRLIHELDCPEPSNQINVTYHATSASELCAGNGELTAIFTEGNTLGDVSDNNDDSYPGEGGDCEEGMDVVFCIDYTGSMGNSIDGVKTGVNNLISLFNTQSASNYRLGLVIFDGKGTSSPSYAGSTYYQNLPAAQKHNQTGTNGYEFITCVEKMSSINNGTSFAAALNVLNQPNGANGMSLGNSSEYGGRAIEMIAGDGFAGQWRAGVQRLIILITDDDPEMNSTYFANTILPAVDTNSAQVLYNTSLPTLDSRYNSLVTGTQPAGEGYAGLNYNNNNWTDGLEDSITQLCEETFFYTCNDLPIGWYMEVGEHTAYYWNGAQWTQEFACVYQVDVNLIDQIANGGIDTITSGTPNYLDSDTFRYTFNYGQTFDVTWDCFADPDYTFGSFTNFSVNNADNVTLQVFTKNGTGLTDVDATLTETQFRFTGTVEHDGVINLTPAATPTAIEYDIELTVIGDEAQNQGAGGDTLDANGVTQSPTGYLYISPSFPTTGWTDVSATYLANAYRQTFTGTIGTSFPFAFGFTPNPSDYDLTVNQDTDSYSSTAQETATAFTYDAAGIQGTVDIISGGGTAEIRLLGDVNQPNFNFTLTADENDTGVSISSGATTNATGYTGDTFPFTIQLTPDSGYQIDSIAAVGVSGANIGAITYTIDQTNDRVTGEITMPTGGGSANIHIDVNTSLVIESYIITINDPFTDSAYWNTVTYTGVAGSSHNTIAPLAGTDTDTTYTITGASSSDNALTVSHNGSNALTLELASMPAGGGSATVTVTGSQVLTTYTYSVKYQINTTTEAYWSSSTGQLQTYTVDYTGTVGSVQTVSSVMETDVDHYFQVIPGATAAGAGLTNPTTTIATNEDTACTIGGTLTMPSGGGLGTLAIGPTVAERSYSYALTVATNSSSTIMDAYDDSLNLGGLAISETYTSGKYIITFQGLVGETATGVRMGVETVNTVDYDPEINSFTNVNPSNGPTISIQETNYSEEGVTLTFEMHSQDPRVAHIDNHEITVGVSLIPIVHDYTFNYSDTIANVNPDNASVTVQGSVNTVINWVEAYQADSGYSFNITGVTTSDSSTTALLVAGGQSIQGTLTMPSGGGSTNIVASGSSSAILYPWYITWNNQVANADFDGGNGDNWTQTLQMQQNSVQTTSEVVVPITNGQWNAYTVTENSSNLNILNTQIMGSNLIIDVKATMPSGSLSQSGTVEVVGSVTIPTRTITVGYQESVFGGFIGETQTSTQALTSEVISGQIGDTGTITRYLRVSPNWTDPNITGVNLNNSLVLTNEQISAFSSLTYHAFTYDYTIPSSNQTSTVTISGNATAVTTTAAPCNCTWTSYITDPSSPFTSDGQIQIVPGAGCTSPYLFTLNGMPYSPTFNGFSYSFNNLGVGNYTIVMEDSAGCPVEESFELEAAEPPPPTTTEAPPGFMYELEECGNPLISITASGSHAWTIGQIVTIAENDTNYEIVDTSLTADFTISGIGDCGSGGPKDPF